MKQLLEPFELGGVAEDDLGDPGAVGAVSADDVGAEAFRNRVRNLGIASEQPVDDLVARDRRCTVPCEGFQRRALAGPDRAGDRDSRRSTTRQEALRPVRLLPGPRRPRRAAAVLPARRRSR
jgi:hypothetical protein